VIPARFGTHTRYRRYLTQARTAEKARQEKLLEDAHPKIGQRATFTESARRR
jgi:hypothetical protein